MSHAAPPPPTLEVDRGFAVTAGVECSAPVVEGGFRQDQLRSTGHWDRVEEDVRLAASLGLTTLRYGIPFHVVARDPERLDWAWTDRALGALQDAGITPIADLLHFGFPDDIRGLTDPALPLRYLEYVEAFVARYPWIRHWTPVNEPGITARLSTVWGFWNERDVRQRAYARAIVQAGKLIVGASEIIRAARPDAVFLQSDGCERWIPGAEEAVDRAALLNEQRYLGWDFAYGIEPGPRALIWLGSNGITDRELGALLDRGSPEGCIVGHDFYIGNHHVIDASGDIRSLEPEPGYAPLALEMHEHLRLPFMLAETNREAHDADRWLAATWNDALRLAEDGLPIRGYCWYGLVDMVDWDTMLAEVHGTVCTVGLADLDRRVRPVGERYGFLAREAAAGRLARLEVAPTAG